ncbi:receptor-type tyrosine-protein phosphatase mu-like [Saccostrea echinata]|uniref:receptor-type tyrosine-protein phosphatase mu-like n=1 Tax=Saccostrea echinata TaxID=191078 RepID=UPI002A8050E8|nr:receptor-type tyrosine-protein phosphatase mu-like [Saccostrea echinata]
MYQNKIHTNIENVAYQIEDPEEEPQIENPEEAVYYNDLSVAKDIVVSDLLNVITQREAKGKEGFLKEFKSLPYGERFDCEIAKTEENMPKNRFKTTFPYDHSRVILEASKGFTSDYINANYIENLDEKREFIACQGPLKNTLVDHWRMIWQEHVDYVIMLTNLTEGPKVKCHQYWPDEGKELNINPFSVTLLEEKKYSHFVERRMTVYKKKVTGSRTVVQYHFIRWPDHGTPNPLNLIVFHRHFRHKIMPSHHPILVHCSAGIGRTGTFIAFDVLSRYGKDEGKVNVIEYVKAMRKDRMTMIQNVNQYVFLYHVLYEFFRRKTHYKKREKFLSQYGDMNKADNQKQITNEFNELISLKPRNVAQDFKSGKAFSELNFSKSVLPVEQYLVYLTSHVPGRQCYYNAVNVSSFTRSDEFLSAQFPVPGAAVDLVRLLIDQESAFLISLNPFSEVEELQSWVEEKVNPLKLSPYIITKGTQEVLSGEIRKTNITITTKKKSLPNVLYIFCKRDGATCCGVFCAVYNAIEQLQQDEEVDIFTIVQQLQCRRPEMISTKEEYEFCFKAVSDFLNTESVYANT